MASLTSKSRNLRVLAVFGPEHHHNVVSETITCLNSNSFSLHWNSFGLLSTLLLLDISNKWALNITQCLDSLEPTRLPGTPVTLDSNSGACGLLWPPLGYKINQGKLLPLLLPKTPPWTPCQYLLWVGRCLCVKWEFHLCTHNQVNLI